MTRGRVKERLKAITAETSRGTVEIVGMKLSRIQNPRLNSLDAKRGRELSLTGLARTFNLGAPKRRAGRSRASPPCVCHHRKSTAC